jgi:hypothetical protein
MSAVNPLDSQEYSRFSPKNPRAMGTKNRDRHHRLMAAELTTKLVVNGLLSAAAIAAFSKLLPYHLAQQAKLEEIRIELRQTEERVDKLRDNFTISFDSYHSKMVMQQQSPKVDPNQRRIFLLEQK